MGGSLLNIILLLKVFFSVLFILVSVAFFTLLERKVLGYSHERLGPNKVFVGGFFQPFRDAIKLFSKEDLKIKALNMRIYFFSPLFFVFLRVFVWVLLPFWGVICFSKFSLVLFICLIGAGVYFLLYRGWCSGSSYRLLGACRSSAQRVSYEVTIIFCILLVVYTWGFIGFLEGVFFSGRVSVFFIVLIIRICWLMSCLAESNRSPFDFSEGESELVSGFNTEYGGGFFSFIFIGEYRFILVLSLVSSVLFFRYIYFFIFFSLVSFFYLWVRCTFARLRYDILIEVSWKGLVFLVISSYLFYFVYF